MDRARWRRWVGRSIVNRITAFALAMALGLTGVVGVISYVAMQNMIRAQVQASLAHRSTLVAQRLQADLNAFATEIGELSRNSFIANGLVDSVGRDVYLQPFLRGHVLSQKSQVDIVLADFKGNPLAANRRLDLAQFRQLPGALAALARGLPGAAVNIAGGQRMLWLFQPVVFPPTGKSEGVLIARVSLDQMFLGYASDFGARHIGQLRIGAMVLQSGAPSDRPQVQVSNALAVVAPLDALQAEWRLSQDSEDAFAALDQLVLVYLAIGALVLVLALMVARSAARRLAAPLVSLAQTAGRITAGDDQPIPLASAGNDEVGQLAKAFDAMLGRLRASYADLEARVAARTGDLSRTNATLSEQIAAREQIERELVLSRDLAEAASRAKSEFVANMSHEIRTPMNAVLGMAHLLGATELSPDQQKYLDMIRVSGQSLLSILNDILDFSKVEAGRMELACAPFLLDDVLATLATIMTVNAGEKDLELAIGVEADVPHALLGDALRLQQVLVNLTGNAIKFTAQGEVAILVECAQRARDSVQLRFSVRDTGIGMDEQQRARLFGAFAQADASVTRRFGGTGLGLAISKRLVGLMGGTIEVDSNPGAGSVFRVWVPLGVGTPPPAPPPLRLLVVDDNATSRDYLCKTIVNWGAQVSSAGSGEQALATARAAHAAGQPFDVVLADWQMPGQDGLATMQALRAQDGAAPMSVVIMASAFGRGKLMQAADAAQADAILVKPVTAQSLARAIDDARARRAGSSGASPFEQRSASLRARLDGVTLLLVEDNPLNQIVARGMLEQAGAQVVAVGDGRAAVEALRAEPQRYELVLMDVQMPVMDGFSATRLIRSELGLSLPVLAMTAGVMASEHADCIASGMNDFIPKPIEVDQMFGVIARQLGRGRQRAPAAAAPAAPGGVFDAAPLMALAAADPGYAHGLLELIGEMVDRGEQQFSTARSAWDGGRLDEAAELLHSMRGAVGTLGAKRFVQATLAAERAMRGGQAEAVPALLDAAALELHASVAQARQWLALQVAASSGGGA